jgi:hypothetical protein
VWTTPISGSGLNSELAVTSNRLALVGGNKLWLLDHGGHVAGQLLDASAQFATTVVADPSGNFYFATSSIISVNGDGVVRTQFGLGRNLSGSQETTSTGRHVLLSPGGLLHFAASDGYLYGLTTDLHVVAAWKRDVGLNPQGGARDVTAGVGDTFFVDGFPYDAATGAISAQPSVAGTAVTAAVPTPSGIGSWSWPQSGQQVDGFMMDRCGSPLWSLPNTPGFWLFQLVSFGDQSLIRHDSSLIWYSALGGEVQPPVAIAATPTGIGADGTIYAIECSSTDMKLANMTLRAYSQDLSEIWHLDLGPPCTNSGTALADDGMLFVAREGMSGIEVLGIQTLSPGLAKTSWPTRQHDNARTGWLPP